MFFNMLKIFHEIDREAQEFYRPHVMIQFNNRTGQAEKMIAIGNDYYTLDYFKGLLKGDK